MTCVNCGSPSADQYCDSCNPSLGIPQSESFERDVRSRREAEFQDLILRFQAKKKEMPDVFTVYRSGAIGSDLL